MISQTAEYALRAMVCLAREPSVRLTTPDIAARAGLPSPYLSKVLLALVRAGVVDSQRGSGGGFRLTRPAETISLLEIVNAVDPMSRHRGHPAAAPAGDDLAALDRQLDAALSSLEDTLMGTTVADLVSRVELPGVPRTGPGPLC